MKFLKGLIGGPKVAISAFSHMTDDQIIDAIHQEFDTAEERLLESANAVLEELQVYTEAQLLEKVRLAKELGFNNTALIKDTKQAHQQIEMNKELAGLVKEYQLCYPTLKFLTEAELDRICEKYNLIYAPVENYVQDVPLKNLREIAAAPFRRGEHHPGTLWKVHIHRFWESVPKKIQKALSEPFAYEPSSVERDLGRPKDSAMTEYIRKRFGVKIDGYVYHDATLLSERRGGLFIAAPQSHFNLEGLEKTQKHGFFSVEKREIKDPVVFRYVKGGIQVLSKWGKEASDPLLVNELNN